MIAKPIGEIAVADLDHLIAHEVREGRLIDYKRDMPGPTADEKKEFLADVSSFANTAGGDLLIGIEEQQGLPIRILGVRSANPDHDIQRFHNLIRDGLEPRLPGVDICFIPTAPAHGVFVIRVRKSWQAPHRISYRGDAKFYGRNSAGKYALDVMELRTAFLLSEGIAERIRTFRAERIGPPGANGRFFTVRRNEGMIHTRLSFRTAFKHKRIRENSPGMVRSRRAHVPASVPAISLFVTILNC